MIIRNRIIIRCFILAFAAMNGYAQVSPFQILKYKPLEYSFDKHYGQVEVGGRSAGAEFHDSRPLPSRISFYYPVANSIDLSTDYWKRGDSRPFAVGVQIGKGDRKWIGREPWSYTVSPHKVVFKRTDDGIDYSMKYEFCLNEPAMVWTITLKNVSDQPIEAAVYTHLKLSLRTCQTYARKDDARMSVDRKLNMIEADFNDSDTDSASVFVQNVGAVPSGWETDAGELAVRDSGTSRWISNSAKLTTNDPNDDKQNALSAFEYNVQLKPGKSASIIQVIGSCKRNETKQIAARLVSSWRKEVDSYEKLVVTKSMIETDFTTNDHALDASAVWAKALLTTNAHSINGQIVPMPCPAEYNFFFSHDVLMTDLAAVNFDLPRVKKDLLYIVSLAKDNIIPHAYYWRDDGFKTEFCTPDNWNHFWFILASGSYLRHSLDKETVVGLFPLITKSLEELLTQVKSDHLMYAFRPDWWDLGHKEGPRAYTTILAIRSLREYLYISTFLDKKTPKLMDYENLADSMQVALTGKLWDGEMKYLTNYNAGIKDKHYYMGSLLASAYGLLDAEHSKELVQTASEQLYDNKIGVRTAMPPDFQTKEAIDFYKFAGEEAGRPYFYINGGVWPHDNAWYAIALNAIGKTDDALQFVKKNMTLDGIVHSPMGQPAMYEYRYADSTSREYGMIDKPSFLWAGGFYLKTLYNLFGERDNEWNISFDGMLPSHYPIVDYTLTFKRAWKVTIKEGGNYLQMLDCGVKIPSLVLPVMNAGKSGPMRVTFGKPRSAYIKSINAIVVTAENTGSNGLMARISSFQGHNISAVIISPKPVKWVEVDGVAVKDIQTTSLKENVFEYEIHFTGADTVQKLQIIL